MSKTIDSDVLKGYNAGIEKNRLRIGLGLIEFERTKELLLEFLPPPKTTEQTPAIIYDIGGGYGEYSWWLSSLGYEVHLFDISETNIKMSGNLKTEYPHTALHSSEVADARNIRRPTESADAILFMGPLYHITEKSERLFALNECRRLLKPEGKLFSAAITRFATILWATTVYGKSNSLLEENAFIEMCESELKNGEHIKPANSEYRGMGHSHFHSPHELENELSEAGFFETCIHGVVGGGWLVPDIDERWKDETAKKAIMRSVRLLDKEKDILGLSTHLLAVSKK
ncbi:MAG: methylase [Clostridia bacterium]|nr:methylase [Clostridia bacterium]